MADSFLNAIVACGLKFVPPLAVQFLDFPPVPLVDLSPKALRRLLRVAASQAAFSATLGLGRKDFDSSASGVLDVDVSCQSRSRLDGKPWYQSPFLLDWSVFLGPLTGATPTADRLYQAGCANTPQCRFCGQEKEDVWHLVGRCQRVVDAIGAPGDPFVEQWNFKAHGIFEIPRSLLQAAFQARWPDPIAQPLHSEDIQLWTDGSVLDGHHFFSRTLACAVISCSGETVFATGCVDPFGSAFKAELMAVYYSVFHFGGQVHITTDCAAIVKVWKSILQCAKVDSALAFAPIWKQIWERVSSPHGVRLFLRWMKAHTADSVQAQMLSLDQALNKRADIVARDTARGCYPLRIGTVDSWRLHTLYWQRWLVKLSQLLAEHPASNEVEDVQLVDPPSVADLDSDLACVKDAFCRWEWDTPEVAFSWMPGQLAASPPPKWKHGLTPWTATVNFFQGLKWMTSEDTLTSSYELAWLWWHRCKWHPPLLHGDKEAGRFSSLLTWCRMVLRYDLKHHWGLLPPNVQYNCKLGKFCSGQFPPGTLFKAQVFLTEEEMKLFGMKILSLDDRGRHARCWHFPLSTC